MFDEIARRFFTEHVYSPDDPSDFETTYGEYITRIADAYRTALAQLDVQVKPKGPEPKPTRTKNGTVMLLLAALENGDIWIRDCQIPMRQQPDGSMKVAGGTITFDAGQFSVEVAYVWGDATRQATFQQIVAFVLADGQRITASHRTRAWLRHYVPTPELDVFSPMLQFTLNQLPAQLSHQWRIISSDAEDRLWHWPDGATPTLWKDARGREL